ncbi:hypothetical protein RRG08_040555 [Elysia crispata]|uniref:Uncharacterized protein n=1 Tax=Elysia crispata TaxID=231223 RepID=A0AAE1DBG3_9GAST|nr:hypothetical protein RRG08_040555 [Elysia crispata]
MLFHHGPETEASENRGTQGRKPSKGEVGAGCLAKVGGWDERGLGDKAFNWREVSGLGEKKEPELVELLGWCNELHRYVGIDLDSAPPQLHNIDWPRLRLPQRP